MWANETEERPSLLRILKDRLANPQPLTIERPDLTSPVIRQLEPSGRDAPAKMRMSGLGRCLRAQAYSAHGVASDGREIDARARMAFAVGDITECVLVTALADALASGALPGWRLGEIRGDDGQAVVSFDLEDANGDLHRIVGHLDGLIISAAGRFVLEVKSANPYAFQQWSNALRAGDDPWQPSESYWWQLQAYLHATRSDAAYVVAMCKGSNALIGFWVDRDPWFVDRLYRMHAKVWTTAPADTPRMLPDGTILAPKQDLHKTRGTPNKAHGELPWQCCYCDHSRTCWPGSEERLQRSYNGRISKKLFVRGVEPGNE